MSQIESSTQEQITESLERLILESSKKEKELKAKIQEKREFIKDALQSVVPYREADKKVKEFTKERKKERDNYLRRPDLAKADQEIKEMTRELKEAREVGSEYALEYSRITQKTLFDLPDGTEAYIVKSAKIQIKMPKLSIRKGRYATRA